MKKTIILLLTLLMLTSCTVNHHGNETADALFQTVCSADEALELAKETDSVVFAQGCTSGKEAWDRFLQNVSAEMPASVLCAHYYTLDKERMSKALYEEEKNEYPKLFFYFIEYNGKEFSVKARESTAEAPDYQETFQNLLHFTGKAPETALYSSYDRYVLTDDPSVTWEDIEARLFSSQFEAGYKHFFVVYEEYIGYN